MNKKNFIEGIITGIVLVMAVNVVLNFAVPVFSSTQSGFNADNKMETIHQLIDTYYVEDYSDNDLKDGMFFGMVYSLGDVYSSYMNQNEFDSFNTQTEGTYAGIGAVVTSTEDGRVMVVSPYDGSPAANAGILPQDIIMEVNGMDTQNAGLEVVVSMMKGEPGTTVNISVFRESEGKTFDLDVVREIITIQTVSHKMMDNNIGYVRLSGFERVTYTQFMEAVNELIADGAEGFILDVRNNPGGLLDIVADICDELVPEGTIVYTEDKNGEQRFLKSDADYLNLPIVLLVNGNSASASEVMAGAIKGHNAGVLIGEQTFGKGLVQNVYPLDDGSAVKLTIARFYTPDGVCIHGEGITPDYVVPMEQELSARVANLTYDEDVQLQKAVEVIEGMIQ